MRLQLFFQEAPRPQVGGLICFFKEKNSPKGQPSFSNCLQVLHSVLTVITYGVPNTPEGSTPSGRTPTWPQAGVPGPTQPEGGHWGWGGPDAFPLRERVEAGHGQQTERKTTRRLQVMLPSSCPPAPSVLPRASSCGPAQRHSEPGRLRQQHGVQGRGAQNPGVPTCTAAPQACELTTGRAHSLCRTETQRGWVICPKSHSWQCTQPDPVPGGSDSKAVVSIAEAVPSQQADLLCI